MDRRSINASLVRATSLAVVLGACAGTGPPIVEHPQSASMAVVAPEHDPLAGALTFGAPPPADVRSAAPRRAVAPRAVLRPARTRLTLHVADYSLSLGAEETRATVAPDIALSAALSASAGPAPRLAPTPHAVVVTVPPAAVEEGAWERSRR